MPKPLDDQQKKLLEVLKSDPDAFRVLTLREIGEKIGVDYAQWVLNKIKQLENRGYVRKDESGSYWVLKEPVEGIYFFPFVSFSHCGSILESGKDDIESKEKIPFPTKTLPISSKSDLRRLFFTRAKYGGDGGSKDGDLLLVKRQNTTTEKDTALVLHNGTPKIRYLNQKDGKCVLIPIDRNTENIELADPEEIAVVGVVKTIISNV